ncbi:MAG: hypothetical protein OEV72_11400 [Thermoleophilia bacterium]|nr:hypothetical protein [Thermoleophilia bacterium]
MLTEYARALDAGRATAVALGPASELAGLESEERSVSALRRRLHERIAFLRGNGVGHDDGQLQRALTEEREVSGRRRQLHARIDELRAQLGLSPGPAPRTSRLG